MKGPCITIILVPFVYLYVLFKNGESSHMTCNMELLKFMITSSFKVSLHGGGGPTVEADAVRKFT